MPSSSASKFVMLRDAAAKANEKTEAARKAAEEKRSAKVEKNAKDVRHWFEVGCSRFSKLSRLPSWRPQDWSNAKRMLQEFGPDVLEKTVLYFWQHWDGYIKKSRGALSGVPNPSLLMAMRSQVFADCELGVVPGAPVADDALKQRVRKSEWHADAQPGQPGDLPDRPAAPVVKSDWGLD